MMDSICDEVLERHRQSAIIIAAVVRQFDGDSINNPMPR